MRRAPHFLALLALALLAGCARLVDADHLRLCRQTLPALNAEGDHFVIQRSRPWQDGGVRLDYTAGPAGEQARQHFVICRFAASGVQANKQELVDLSTDKGVMSGTALFMLKRFWLETADATLADPGAGADLDTAERVYLPRAAAIALQNAISALPPMAIYALLAAAYAMIYGLIGRINLAFGEFAALGGTGAVLAIAALLSFGFEGVAATLLAALAGTLIVTLVHAQVVARLMLVPLAGRSGQHLLVATAGLAIALQEYIRLTRGSGTQWVSPIFNTPIVVARTDGFLVTLTPIALAISAIALIASLALLLVLKYSTFGRAWRAVADDPLAARLFGISTDRIYAQTFVAACGLAGLAGLVVTLYYGGIGFAGGTFLGLKALVGAVAGGIGSVPGAILGGLLIGAIEAAWSIFLPIDSRDIAIFALLAILLALKPGGLFGFGALSPRKV